MKEMFADLAKYRIQRAFETKGDAEILFKSDKLVDAANRIYHANFYAVKSLMATRMFDSAKHQIVIQNFHSAFIHSGEIPKEFGQILDRSYRSRSEGDVNDIQLEQREVESLLKDCERFLVFVREHLKKIVVISSKKEG